MKKNQLKAAVLILAIATLTGCVNEAYDLRNLDPSVTILSGLKIHVNQDQEKSVIKNQSFFTQSEAIKQLPGDQLAISGTKHSPANACATYQSAGVVNFETSLYIGTSSWVNEILPGAIINAPLVPVIQVSNPTDIIMDLYGTAKCGEKAVRFGPFSVNNGTSYIKLDMEEIKQLSMPVSNDIELCDLRLVWKGDLAPKTEDSFSIEAYAPLTFNPGEKIFVEYPCSETFLAKIDLQEKAEKHHISVESLSVNVDIVNNFPLDLSIYASGELDNGPASASISPAIAAGDMDNPVKSSITIKAQLAKGAHAIKNATVCVEGKVSANHPVSITSEQNFSYSVVDIVLDSGITLGL